MPLEDFIITTYCLVEDLCKQVIGNRKLRSRGFMPKLSEAEIITMEIVGEFLEIDTDMGIWKHFKNNWSSMFPGLGSRANFAKQCANLWVIKQEIQSKLAKQTGALGDDIHMADGFPILVAHFKRSKSSRLFKGEASYGYCASKDETYYGFKGNICISSEGIITGYNVTAANIDERDSLYEISQGVGGLMLADKGLIGEDYQQQFRQETSINLQTPLRKNMTDNRGKDASSWLVSTRRLVETVIGQLATRFNIEKVRARDCWHLTCRVTRKILAHTVGAVINKSLNHPAIQFSKLNLCGES